MKIITQNPKHAHKTSQIPFHARQNLPTSPYAQQNIRPPHCKKPSKAPLQNAHNQQLRGSMVPNQAAFGSYAQNQTNLNNQQQPYHVNTQNLSHGYYQNTYALQNKNYGQPPVQSRNNCYQNLPNNCGYFLKNLRF